MVTRDNRCNDTSLRNALLGMLQWFAIRIVFEIDAHDVRGFVGIRWIEFIGTKRVGEIVGKRYFRVPLPFHVWVQHPTVELWNVPIGSRCVADALVEPYDMDAPLRDTQWTIQSLHNVVRVDGLGNAPEVPRYRGN